MGASTSSSSPPSSPFKQRLNVSPEEPKVAFNESCQKLIDLYSNRKIAGYTISMNPEEWNKLIDEVYNAISEIEISDVLRIRDKIANIDFLIRENKVNSVQQMTIMKKGLEEQIKGITKMYDDEKEKSKKFVSETIDYFKQTCDEDALRILYNLGYFLQDGKMVPFFTMKEYKANGKDKNVLLKYVDAKINHYYAAELAPELNIEWSGGSKKRRHKMKYSHSRRRSSKYYSHSRRSSKRHLNK